MTRAEFIEAALAELKVTRPETEEPAARILAGQAHDLLLEALGCDSLGEAELPLAEELTAWRYNRLGSEGIGEESVSGISQRLADDIPAPLRRAIARRRRLRWS